MTALAPILEAFFTERLAASATPARTPSPPTATPPPAAALRPQPHRPTAPSARPRRSRRRAASAAFLDPPRNRRGQHHAAPATPASPPSTRSSATPPCAIPNTPSRSSGCCDPAETHRAEPRLLPHPRRDRRAAGRARPTTPGSAAAITPCSRGGPDRAARLRADRTRPAAMSTWAPAHTFAAAARDARNARRRLPPTPSPRSPAGSANTTAARPIRCSRPVEADR